MATSTPNTLRVVSRVAASLLGGYAFVWGFITLGVVMSVGLGMPYSDAAQLFYLLAFLLFVVCFCGAFVVRSLIIVWVVLGFGGALMTLLGHLLAQAMV